MPRLPNQLSRRRALELFGGSLAAPALLAARPGMSHAQATPVGTPTTARPSDETITLVRYTHPEKVYFYLPGFADEALRAGLYGLDVAQYAAIKEEFAAAARGAAAELLTDAAFAQRVDRLPFAANAVVIAIGESDTDDLQSWFEILRHLLDLRRPADNITMVNLAVSGQTTTQASDQLFAALAQQPDWFFCLLGGNDATRLGAGETQVSPAETERNLAELRRLATAETGARWVWLTRTPVDEARVAAYEVFQQVGIAWRDADMARINAFLARQPEPVVDTYAVFGDPAGSPLLEADGLHPSLAGQQVIAQAVVETLAG